MFIFISLTQVLLILFKNSAFNTVFLSKESPEWATSFPWWIFDDITHSGILRKDPAFAVVATYRKIMLIKKKFEFGIIHTADNHWYDQYFKIQYVKFEA